TTLPSARRGRLRSPRPGRRQAGGTACRGAPRTSRASAVAGAPPPAWRATDGAVRRGRGSRRPRCGENPPRAWLSAPRSDERRERAVGLQPDEGGGEGVLPGVALGDRAGEVVRLVAELLRQREVEVRVQCRRLAAAPHLVSEVRLCRLQEEDDG